MISLNCTSSHIKRDRDFPGSSGSASKPAPAKSLYTNGSFGVIHELYVLPEHRSNKVGALLIDAMKAIGEERRWNRIEVGAPSPENWGRTIKFYKEMGFEEIGPRMKLLLG
jgi:GNAT superfamily N-acetyltransferase